MKKFLTALALLLCLSAAAQTNITFTKITRVTPSPDPALSNYSRITLVVTNITPNQPYGLPITRRLELGWIPYIVFQSPSNWITILRDTATSIPIRFYKVAPSTFSGNFVQQEGFFIQYVGDTNYDDVDIPCEACDQEDAAAGQGEGGGDPSDWPFFPFMSSSRSTQSDIPQEILDIIMPPPLRRKE